MKDDFFLKVLLVTITTQYKTDGLWDVSRKCHENNIQQNKCRVLTHLLCVVSFGLFRRAVHFVFYFRSSILLLTGVSCSGGSFIVIAAFVLAVCYFKRKNLQESATVQPSRPLPEINHYDEINPYDEMSLENMPVASDIVSPYYSYAREQFQRLSLPSTNVRLNNQTRNGEPRGYISLPNLSNDGSYPSPYNWNTESSMVNVNSNPNWKPLQRGDSETSDYLHPYNALSRPIDFHEYKKIEHVENQTVHKNDILTIHNQVQITIELEKVKGE